MNASHLYDFSRGNGITIDANTFPSTANFVSYIQAAVPGVPNDGNRIDMTLDGTQIDMRIMVNDAQVAGTQLTLSRPAHRWWRMRGNGTMVIWETSPDGQTWTQRHTATSPFPLTPLDVNIGGRLVFPVAEALAARGVPIVFATGYGRSGLPAAWQDHTVLSKPYTAAEVASALGGLCARHKAAGGSALS